jgi:phosphate transport system substrate-binding protein
MDPKPTRKNQHMIGKPANRFQRRGSRVWVLTAFAIPLIAGCSVESPTKSGKGQPSQSAGELSGSILIDGSSTVLPISRAVAEEFEKTHRNVKVSVGSSGTGGGFTKFAAGETDINDASRPIKAKEKEDCEKNKIEPIELKIAIDGLTVVVNQENDWCDHMTVEQLQKIWEPNSTVKKWSDVDANWPDEPIVLYGADTDSGTFDYFTEAICGKEGASRTDYTASANDNVLVRGVSGDKYSLGYFGYAYYVENKDKLKPLGVASSATADKPVFPTDETIESGQYAPLSRPLFIYVSKKSFDRPEVAAFVKFYLNEGQPLVHEERYIRLNEAVLAESKRKIAAK